MPWKPLTPDKFIPPNLVQVGESGSTPTATITISDVTSEISMAMGGGNIALLGTGGNINIAASVSISQAAFADLSAITSLNGAAALNVTGAPIQEIDFSNLATLAESQISISTTSITSLDLDALTAVTGGTNQINIASNAGLVTLAISSLETVVDGFDFAFTANALNAASVNGILAAVLFAVTNSSVTSGTLNISGGTNAAPTGQGITDKADLITAGITVTTN